MSEEYEWIARKSINFFRLTILAVSRKPGLTYLTIAHTSSAAARLQLFPFKPGFLFVLGGTDRPMEEIARLAAAGGAASRLLTKEISWSIYSSGIHEDAVPRLSESAAGIHHRDTEGTEKI